MRISSSGSIWPAVAVAAAVAALAAGWAVVHQEVGAAPGSAVASGPRPAEGPTAVEVRVGVAVPAEAAQRRRFGGTLDALVGALPSAWTLDLYTLGTPPAGQYSGHPRSPRALWALWDGLPAAPAHGASPSALLEVWQREIASRPGESDYLVLLSDSAADPGGQQALVSQVGSLTQLPQIRGVWLALVAPAYRLQAGQNWSALGDRLVVSGPADNDSGMRVFQTWASARR